MARRDHLKEALDGARGYSTSLFSSFGDQKEWVHQPHPSANHAMWCAGHIASTDNFALSVIAPERAVDKPRYKELFGSGSSPKSDVAAYPPAAEVLDYMAERRSTLLSVLDGLSDEDLAKATPEGAPAFMPTVGSVFRILIWHEGLHAGQASIAHRSLGKSPIMG